MGATDAAESTDAGQGHQAPSLDAAAAGRCRPYRRRPPAVVDIRLDYGQLTPAYCRPDRGVQMPSKPANVKNEKQYEKLKDKGMSKSRAARIANSPGASSRGGKKSGSGSSSKQGGTTAQKKAAGAKGGKAAAGKK